MLVYKSLRGGRSLFTGFRWPVPHTGGPGDWVGAGGPPAMCRNGFHGCTGSQLPLWLSTEVFVMELDGEMIDGPDAVVGTRARLVRPVAGWTREEWVAFGRDCADRLSPGAPAEGRPRELVDDVLEAADDGDPAMAGYISAIVAGEMAAGAPSGDTFDRAFAAERNAQAGWLVAQLLPAL